MLTHDLHVHLYGCLTASDLWQLGQSQILDPKKCQFFQNEYAQQFGEYYNLQKIIKQQDFQTFQNLIHLKTPCSFLQFQAKFNLIVTLCHLDQQQEVFDLVYEICKRHESQGLRYVEYRMPIPLYLEEDVRRQLLVTICAVFQRFQGSFQPRLSVSLARDDSALDLYLELKKMMSQSQVICEMVVSIDFCFVEEGFPPKSRKKFYQQVLQDNQKNPNHALAILDHVGEVFADKSLESAVRWIHQSAMFETHRLGHAIALGIDPELLIEKVSCETIQERLDQISYELQYLTQWQELGIACDENKLHCEYETLQNQPLDSMVKKTYDLERVNRIRKIQDFVMQEIKKLDKCVESCLTSNQMLNPHAQGIKHPILRFLNNGIPVVLGSDDPGIFQTSLKQEEEKLVQQFKVSEQTLELIENTAKNYRSEYLSGRFKK